MERKHFWHVGRKEIILDVLRRNIPDLAKCHMLEIGCGNGNVLLYLKQNGVKIEGGDISVAGLKYCHQRDDLIPLHLINVMALPFVDDYDIIGLFDVLEHIDDDNKALWEIAKALKPHGKLLLTVPAHKFLWGYFDVFSVHKRRYNRRELIAKLERGGFTIKKLSYYVSFLFPLLVGIRVINKLFHKKDVKTSLEMKTILVINEFLLLFMRMEKILLRYLNIPFGASLIVLAEKSAESVKSDGLRGDDEALPQTLQGLREA
jgi:SAM-dependent methyltransferase